ncbi:pentapeptide repeat-containing protein (plasmid) [Rhizobium sp. B230/85]|uniref:pentapeptide repeat-containing protein n=1 Tax=unclassified Rhizobium TaxID=2613769 RepID=UPI001ADCD617|nr:MULTISPECIES: pentapeptide repeat-containing protein [unclassified Rhizobium]MBO9134471.1 pentapeptide repeat-containing protein [Rhizobium sp. B209b/85]QXZ99681.1 pentapeptide repeat-containing protein [Rhizobium sp. B230/85]
MSPALADASKFSPVQTVEGKTLDRAAAKHLASSGTTMRLVDCNLEEADLSRLNFSGWLFEACNVKKAIFTGSILEATTWIRCKGGLADFKACNLSEARFEGSDFNNSSFRGATLTDATFTRCKLTGATLSECKTLNLTMDGTLLMQATLPGVSFRKMRLTEVSFDMADLRKCDFRETLFQGCSLRDANLAECRFEDADLRGADLGGIRLLNAKQFKGATISRDQAGQLLAELGLKVR